MTDGLNASDVALLQNSGRNDGFFGGDGAWWIIILFLFAFCGGWNNGGFGGSQGASQNYVLASDFATLQRQLSDGFGSVDRKGDQIVNGLCDGFYTNAQLINGVNMNIANTGFGLQNAIQQNGYESRLATQTLQSAMQNCCCDLRQQIGDVNYNIATQANGIGRQIERGFADTNYNMATQNCATMQAIDKVGDRVIDYLANQEAQKLRDENFSLRLAASQEKQNNYLVDQLAPKCPIPAYITCNPNAPLNYSVNYGGCGCN